MKQIIDDGCEVIHLQEIWNAHQIRKIEQLIDLDYLSYSPNKTSRNGLMSFSRWNMSWMEYHKFETNKDGGILDRGRSFFGVEKGFAVLWLDTPVGQMAFVNLHLHPTSKAVRIAQVLQLIVWRMRVYRYPIVLTGDFNMTPDSIEKKLVSAGLRVKDAMFEFYGKYDSSLCTYCAGNRLGWLSDDRVLDYFFYSENSPLAISNVEINLKGTPEQPLSDHFGVKVSFEFSRTPELAKDLLVESKQLIRILKQAMIHVKEERTKESDIYELLLVWQDQLQRQEGQFWRYFADHFETQHSFAAVEASGFDQ